MKDQDALGERGEWGGVGGGGVEEVREKTPWWPGCFSSS